MKYIKPSTEVYSLNLGSCICASPGTEPTSLNDKKGEGTGYSKGISPDVWADGDEW